MVGCTNSQGVFNCTCTHTQILARSHTHTQLRQTPKGDLGSSSFALGRVYDDSQDSGRTCASPTVSEEYNSLRTTPTALDRFYGLKRLWCVKLCHLLVIGHPIVGEDKYVRDGLCKDPRDMLLPISTSLCYQYMCRANVHL